MKTKFKIGAKSTKYGQSPVNTPAKTPVTTVLNGFLNIPLQCLKNSLFYNSNAEYHILKIMKKERIFLIYCSASSVVVLGISDCKIWIFCNNSVRRSLATLLTVGRGTPSSSTTLV